MTEQLKKLLRNFPTTFSEIESLGEITDFYFDFAYGVTPSIFVNYKNEDGEILLERVRLPNNFQDEVRLLSENCKEKTKQLYELEKENESLKRKLHRSRHRGK